MDNAIGVSIGGALCVALQIIYQLIQQKRSQRQEKNNGGNGKQKGDPYNKELCEKEHDVVDRAVKELGRKIDSEKRRRESLEAAIHDRWEKQIEVMAKLSGRIQMLCNEISTEE